MAVTEKKETKETKEPKESKKSTGPKGKYFEAVGRRKTAIARVRLYPEDKKLGFIVNGKVSQDYFGTDELATVANAPLRKTKLTEEFGVTVKTEGGGPAGQADAVRLGVARALVKFDEELRLRLKKSGYLKRDPRAKERKKYGLKGARKAAQWSKR